jgi:hypothetical protein
MKRAFSAIAHDLGVAQPLSSANVRVSTAQDAELLHDFFSALTHRIGMFS